MALSYFTFARITEFFGNNIIKELSSGVVILLLSITSYFFLERPFRNRKYQFKNLFIILLSFFIVLISINFYVINEEGVKSRLPKIFQVKLKEENVILYQNDDLQKVVLLGDYMLKPYNIVLMKKLKK